MKATNEGGIGPRGDEAKESDPLISKGEVNDWTFGLSDWMQVVHRALGYKLLMMLFVVEHLLRGFVAEFSGAAQSYVYKSYKVPAPSMQVYGGITTLPWALKPIIGLASDLFPVAGYNKAPYMAAASLLGAVAFIAVGTIPASYLPLLGLVLCLFFQNMQLSVNDILTEARYATKIRESPDVGPTILTYVWFGMGAAGLVGTLLSGVFIDHIGPRSNYLVCAIPATMVLIPLALGYMEEKQVSEEDTAQTRRRFFHQKEACFLCVTIFLSIILLTVVALATADPYTNCVTAVIVFIFTISSFSLVLSPRIAMFNAWSLLQSSLSLSTSAAGFYFMTDTREQYPEGPHFSPLFYNSIMGTTASILSLVGVATYEKYLSRASYRSVLVVTNVALSGINLLDIFFYLRLNVRWGIPDRMFVLSTSVLGGIIGQWQWMPQVIILSYFCPKGMEATMYALLAGCHNLGNTIASSCGAYLLLYLGVNPDGSAHESEQFANLWKASLISSVLPLVSVVALFRWIPDVKQGDQIIDTDCDATTGSLWKAWTGSETTGTAEITA